jgi:transposase InsO family protein
MINDTAAASQALTVIRQETWLSYEDVMRLEGISRAELFERLKAGKYQTKETGEVSRNGKAKRVVALGSLTPAGQARCLAERKDVADGIAVPVPAKAAGAPVERRLRGAAVPLLENGDVDVAALQRAGRVTEVEAYLQRSAAVSRVLAARAAAGHGDKGLALATVATELSLAPETIRNWLKTWKRGGNAALVPGYGALRGIYKVLPEGLQKAILASYRSQQRQSVAQIMRHTVQPWCATHGYALPNRRTVDRFIEREVFAAEERAFRHGKRNWEEAIMAKVTRDPGALAVNDLWCADHRRFDMFVIAPDGYRMVRPWLTLYVDIASARFVGWCIREKPNSQSVALALRAGILECGVPKVLYHDNGKDFCANRLGGGESWRVADPTDGDVAEKHRWPALLPPKFMADYGQLTLAELGVERVIHAIPYSSWSKPIESIFWAFHRQWENMNCGYCGGRPETKPEKLKAEMKAHRLLMWDQFVAEFRKHVADWNTNHRCGDRPHTAAEYYGAAEGELRRVPAAKLDQLMLRSENRVIPPQGIEVGGKKFLDEQCALFVGERATVLYDPDNLQHIIVCPARYEGQKRLIVSEIPHAGWFEFSEANRIALGIRRAQRQALQAVAVSDAAVRVPEYVDPTGANRLAVANAEAYKAAQAAQAGPEAVGLVAELKAAERAVEARETAVEGERKARLGAVAADIVAAAAREAAHRRGE